MAEGIFTSIFVISTYGLFGTLWIATNGLKSFNAFIGAKLTLLALIGWFTVSLLYYIGSEIIYIFF